MCRGKSADTKNSPFSNNYSYLCQASRPSAKLLSAKLFGLPDAVLNTPTDCAQSVLVNQPLLSTRHFENSQELSRSMVRVKLLVKIIPEDVYLRDVESHSQPRAKFPLAEEKRLLQVVPEPESISIGVLANQIRETFQRINHESVTTGTCPVHFLIFCFCSHLGDIKYLKDGAIDADLDPEMSVYDAFVDAGKAATSLDDQSATIKIIREIRGQRFDVRQGSVVPDLDNPRFQPRRPPPVPRFSDTNQSLGKRSRDVAFREEDPGRSLTHTSKSVRLTRLDALQEIEAEGRLVPSTERDLLKPSREASHHRQHSPIVIPETQDSPLRYRAISKRAGSQVLGDDEPKSESPEVGDSIHSLPIAQHDVDDREILETALSTRNLATRGSIMPEHFQDQFEAISGQEPTSRSSSNYFSPASGSLQLVAKERMSGKKSAPSSAEHSNASSRPDPTRNFTRTRLHLAKEGPAHHGAITPTSDAFRRRHSKDNVQASSHNASNEVGPQSRTSSSTYKFRREDQVHSVESEIDDSQMSPRSRKSLKRPQNARHSEAARQIVPVRELAGLFDYMGEERPLIQEQKRNRKETKWDFSERVDRLCESDEEDHLPNKDQELAVAKHVTANGHSSEGDEAEDLAGQRSKSHALSDATNKDSNASTERPVTFASLNAIRVSRPAQNQASAHGTIFDVMSEDDSDKENAQQEQAIHPQSHPSDFHRDIDPTTQRSSKADKKEQADGETEHDVTRLTEGSVFGVHDKVTSTQSDPLASSNVEVNQRLSDEAPEGVDSAPVLSKLPSSKKPRPRKKKSRVEEDGEKPKSDSQQRKAHSAAKPITNDASHKANNRGPSTIAKPKTGKRAISLSQTDEQLSQDLQASARADSSKTISIPKNRKALARKQEVASNNVPRVVDIKPSTKSSTNPQEATPNPGQTPSIDDQEQRPFSDTSKNQALLDSNAGATAAAAAVNNISPKATDQERVKDGKLGLGFSQSPPSKHKDFLQAKVSFDHLDQEYPSESLKSLRDGKEENSFLKKSKSFEKTKSSQSWIADTPSRCVQSRKEPDSTLQHIIVDVPGRKQMTDESQNKTRDSTVLQTTTSGSDSEFEPDFVEDALPVESQEISKAGQTALKNGTTKASADAPVPSLEVTSDSDNPDSDIVLPPSMKVTKVSQLRDDGPIIIPMGKNAYNINGTQIVVPPGFTLDAYLARRADLARQPPKANLRRRITSSGKSATPTLNHQASSSTPVPAQVKVAPKKTVSKKNEKQQPRAAKERGLGQPSIAPMAAKISAKQTPQASQPKDAARSSVAAATGTAQAAILPAPSEKQLPTKTSISAKNRPVGPMSTSNRHAAVPPAKPLSASHPPAAKKATNLSDYKAQREAERAQRAAASSSKTLRLTSLNLVNNQNFLEGGDSASESESETASSDEDAVTSKVKPTPAKTPATGIAMVDLSIRDPSPSSDEEDL